MTLSWKWNHATFYPVASWTMKHPAISTTRQGGEAAAGHRFRTGRYGFHFTGVTASGDLKTAKALGLTVPNSLIVSADEVIE